MSANLLDLIKPKRRPAWDERLPDGTPAMQTWNPAWRRGTGSPNSMEVRTGELEGIAPPRQTPTPALQRTALGVPNGDIIDLLKRSPQPPPPVNGPVTIPPVNARVGTDLSGMNEQQRQQAKVDLMRATPAGQKVRQHGDLLEAEPPEQSPSRVKNALLGLLLGTAQGGLAGGIAGAGLGAVKPGAIQELLKQKHLAREEGVMDADLEREARRADTDLKRARIEEMRRPPEAKVYAPELRTDANGNLISVQGTVASPVLDKQGNPVKGRVSENGETVEVEVNGRKLHVTPAQALTYFGQIGAREDRQTQEQREREAKRQAAQDEYDQLVRDEENAGAEKNKAYAYLEQVKKNVPDDEMGRADIAEARRAAEEADKIYKSYADKKREAQRKISENTVSSGSSTQQYAGRTMSQANLERYAKDHNMTVEAAKTKLEKEEGITIR